MQAVCSVFIRLSAICYYKNLKKESTGIEVLFSLAAPYECKTYNIINITKI